MRKLQQQKAIRDKYKAEQDRLRFVKNEMTKLKV